MNQNTIRAGMLIDHHRYKEAMQFCRAALADDPNDSMAYWMLAHSLTQQGRHFEALRAVRQSLRLNPNAAHAYATLAVIHSRMDDDDAALRSIQDAIRLDPRDPDAYAQQGQIYLDQKKWQEAVDSADEGLRIDPEHDSCANVRATALIKLGRRAEAVQTLGNALARDPENALSHANQGWNMLHVGQHKQAMHHFREALRIDPDLEWARRGIIEAIKARNPVYRVMLGYFLWMSRFSTRVQWGIVLGAFFGYQILRSITNSNPELAPLATIITAVYLAFAIMTWVSSEFFDLTLMFSSFGRLALPARRRIASTWIGLCLAGAIGFAGIGAVLGGDMGDMLLLIALETAMLIVPVAGTFKSDDEETRHWLSYYTLALAGLVGLGLLIGLNDPTSRGCNGCFILGWVAYTWIAAFMISRGR